MTTQAFVQRGSPTLLSEELERIEALLGDGRAINSDGRWDSDLARLMVRLRFHQARIKHRIALVGKAADGREHPAEAPEAEGRRQTAPISPLLTFRSLDNSSRVAASSLN